ncbi:MAG TPA: GMC family oxidoreductase N-terminal domain-containing protein [Amaricoccus sp.]|uniref:GMC family oxidoreductase n=1 Tax=Amaricoccus sp. TaxID=1872485 RepID=UPI002CF3F981|nr:GMC family oxidoreductase N-terminal domain-containing protein [Amaricoccus sp.]HMQ93975.1 GMC family oxidoreductase N-terminal domain-containing protein [Amaricoccus sp.]HMR52831.1 GMC family oxidoreductase N-terminal domain-containing protein [Amaricoccus sp.]HMR60805.1 GMC family oxidoreductase N-terminal domain-containing protein [Amaricoccus sp.]HMT99766.1 GMC family oxidoreductase N-terminal domain-containing protein [Amaricoccus sp.]
MSEEFDHVIVGAGTAGCLLANRLSASGERRVLLVEAGGRDNYPWIHIPVGYLYCIGNPRTDWMYATEAEPGLNGRSLRYPRGRVLGGCSSINGMIYMRGQARDYDAWAELTGEPDWAWDNVLPDFIAHESHWRAGPGADPAFNRLHGAAGEWRIEKQRLSWEILDAFSAAAQEAGIPARADFNDGDNEGVGYFEVNQRRGWRWNAASAFLRPARGRPNLTIWTGAETRRLSLGHGPDGGLLCAGVELARGGETLSVRARRGVILAAGAVNSPKILQLSGLGPAALLGDHGIEVRADLPGVGGNLQDHLQLRTVFRVSGTRTLNTTARSLAGKAAIALEYALRRTGPMSMAPSQLGVFTRSRPGLNHANLEYHVQPLSLEAFGEGLHDFPAITASVCNLNPTSRGNVAIASAEPGDPPRIRPNYLSTEEDRTVAAESLRVTRRIVAQPALARFRPQEWKPGPGFQTDADLVRAAGDIGTTIFHPVGTTAMGRDEDPQAVLDPRLRMRDGRGGRIGGLRVVDAGAMPLITSGNTNAPVLMMAEKAARWILAEA